jgi:hypothetical protein
LRAASLKEDAYAQLRRRAQLRRVRQRHELERLADDAMEGARSVAELDHRLRVLRVPAHDGVRRQLAGFFVPLQRIFGPFEGQVLAEALGGFVDIAPTERDAMTFWPGLRGR